MEIQFILFHLQAAFFQNAISAAYLLEPCHQNFVKTKTYGLGSDFLPESLAMPMKFLSDRVKNGKPLLDYAYGYALFNWKFHKDPNPAVVEYNNEDVLPPRSVGIR